MSAAREASTASPGPSLRGLPRAVTYCPHCAVGLTDHPSRTAERCPVCRLVIGAGRAREAPDPEASYAGFMASAARREEAAVVTCGAAFGALRRVARDIGCPVQRLRMIDYDRAIQAGFDGPSVAAIIATFDTWKGARAAARSA